jgi:hypothetical protein
VSLAHSFEVFRLIFLLFFLEAASGLMLEDSSGVVSAALSVDFWVGESTSPLNPEWIKN